jgi:hypothetical protein
MGLFRRYTLTLTREDVTDEGVVVKDHPQIICRFKQSENELKMSYLNENVIAEMVVDKLCNGIKQELQNPNQAMKTEEEDMEQTIVPLHL